jgi:hypothetical protein
MRYRSSLLSCPCARLLSTRAIAPTNDGIRISAPARQSATQMRARKMVLVSGDARPSAITQISQRIKILPPTRHAIACAHAAAQCQGSGADMFDAAGRCFGPVRRQRGHVHHAHSHVLDFGSARKPRFSQATLPSSINQAAGKAFSTSCQSVFIAGDDRSSDAGNAAPHTLLFALRSEVRRDWRT